MTKSNFEKVAASWMVSWEFLVIFEDSSITQKCCSRAFLCAKGHATFYFCLHCSTEDIIRIILSALFVSLETVLLALVS